MVAPYVFSMWSPAREVKNMVGGTYKTYERSLPLGSLDPIMRPRSLRSLGNYFSRRPLTP